MEKEKQVDTDSPLVTWLTPAIDSALAALTPPPPLISTCLLPAEVPPTGSGVDNLGRKWTKLNQMDKEERDPQLMSSTQSEWNSKEMRGGCLAISEEKKSDMCNLGNLGMWRSGKVKLFFFLKKFTFPHLAGRCHIASLPHVSRFHRTASVQGWFPPRCAGLPNCCLIHNCTCGHSIADPLDLPPFWVM